MPPWVTPRDPARFESARQLAPMAKQPLLIERPFAMVVEPVLLILKSVDVAKLDVVDDMLKTTPLFGVPVALVRILMRPKGLVVPMPREPLDVKVLVPVAPKAALLEVWVRVKSEVPVALVKLSPPLRVVSPLKVFVLVNVLAE